MADIATLLGTHDAEQQAQRVEQLIATVNAQIVTLVVQYDGRSDQVRVLQTGEPLDDPALQHLLTRALLSCQVEAAHRRQSQEAQD